MYDEISLFPSVPFTIFFNNRITLSPKLFTLLRDQSVVDILHYVLDGSLLAQMLYVHLYKSLTLYFMYCTWELRVAGLGRPNLVGLVLNARVYNYTWLRLITVVPLSYFLQCTISSRNIRLESIEHPTIMYKKFRSLFFLFFLFWQ